MSRHMLTSSAAGAGKQLCACNPQLPRHGQGRQAHYKSPAAAALSAAVSSALAVPTAAFSAAIERGVHHCSPPRASVSGNLNTVSGLRLTPWGTSSWCTCTTWCVGCLTHCLVQFVARIHQAGSIRAVYSQCRGLVSSWHGFYAGPLPPRVTCRCYYKSETHRPCLAIPGEPFFLRFNRGWVHPPSGHLFH